VVSVDKNVKVIFVSGLLSAFVIGIFELLFPFYLESIGISLIDMGLIISASTLVISFLRIILGEYADVYGKKKVYLASCATGIASKAFFPFSLDQLQVLGAKFLNDLQDNLRQTVHGVMLYENAKDSYTRLLSWFTTVEFLLQASGTIFFAFFLSYLGYSGLFLFLAAVEAAKFTILLMYRENKKKEGKKMSLREAYSFKIDRNLLILALTSAIAALGFGIAHGFLLPLYFQGKYNLDVTQISILTVLHRLSFMTTPLAERVIKKMGLRKTHIFTTSAYALSFLAIGLWTFPIPIFVALFLIHDLLGGGIGSTATSVMMQKLTDDETRSRQINTFNAIQTPLAILAPSMSGMLAAMSWDYTFIVGGLLYSVSLCFFCLLYKGDGGKSKTTNITH
jgi:MFS family permease